MQKTPALTISLTLAAAVVANRFIGFDGEPAGAAEKALGVSTTDGAIGDANAVDVLGTTTMEAGGAIAVGGPIKSDADGKGIAQGGAGEILAYAIEAAAADGQIIEVLLTP